jgi:hypothetical protein
MTVRALKLSPKGAQQTKKIATNISMSQGDMNWALDQSLKKSIPIGHVIAAMARAASKRLRKQAADLDWAAAGLDAAPRSLTINGLTEERSRKRGA